MQYFIGIGWFILSLLISSINDVLAKFLCDSISSLEVSFFRFFFGTISLIPFILYNGIKSIKSSRPLLHFIRGSFLAVAIFLWIKGLSASQLTTATIISFTIPIFILIFAPIFLKEKVSLKLWIVTIIGMLGIVITLAPYDHNFNWHSVVFLISTMLFASLDIINKKYVIKESMLSMLFYSSLVTTFLALFPIYMSEQTLRMPIAVDLVYIMILGVGSNFILFCLLKAFQLVKASSVAPFRYLELIFSILFGYIIFNELPSYNAYIGASIIIPCSFYIVFQKCTEK